MGRKGRQRPAELVLRLVEIGAQTLAEQLGVPDERARAAMREIAHQLCNEYGGQNMYVAKESDCVRAVHRVWREGEKNSRVLVGSLP